MNNSQQHTVATDRQQVAQCKHWWDVIAYAGLNGSYVQELRMNWNLHNMDFDKGG